MSLQNANPKQKEKRTLDQMRKEENTEKDFRRKENRWNIRRTNKEVYFVYGDSKIKVKVARTHRKDDKRENIWENCRENQIIKRKENFIERYFVKA